MKTMLIIIIVMHGLIHIMGFAKAFNLAAMSQLTRDIPRRTGLLWLIAALLLIAGAIGLLLGKDWWWVIALPAVVLSQALIIAYWHDAKFGTIANIIILFAVITGFAGWQFYRSYGNDVRAAMASVRGSAPVIIRENDLRALPAPVQRYLRYAGVVNRQKPVSMKITFSGEMRGRGKDWFAFSTEQYNFFGDPARYFFMKGRMFGVSVWGYHAFSGGKASMVVRLLSLFTVADYRGKEMDIAETVTLFNDMCLMAPASLVDARIRWEAIDGTAAKATFTSNGISISARLVVNELGQLVNFISDDRFDLSGGTPVRYRFSTPVKHYRAINGLNIPTYGETVWHYPDGEFCYGKFTLQSIEYDGKP